jgi:group I intron endonuclease
MISNGLNKVCGVYSITHIGTGMRYIGSSVNVGRRFHGHINGAKNNGTMRIHRALMEHGIDAFDFELVEVCDRGVLREREEFWIHHYQSASASGFNTRANPTEQYYSVGVAVSDATRERISEAHKENALSPEYKEWKASEALRLHNKSVWSKISHAHVSRRFNIDVICKKYSPGKISIRLKKIIWMYCLICFPELAPKLKKPGTPKGTQFTLEHCAKISSGKIGKKPNLSPVGRTRMRTSVKGRKLNLSPEQRHSAALSTERMRTPEANKKRSESLTGRKLSPESIEKRVATMAMQHITGTFRPRVRSVDWIEKQSASHKGTKLSQESIAKRESTKARNRALAQAEAQCA